MAIQFADIGNLEQAVPALIIQIGILAVLGIVLAEYSRQHCRLVWCFVGIFGGGLAGSVPLLALALLNAGGVADSIAISIHLYWFAMSAGVGMIIGGLTIATGKVLHYTAIKRRDAPEHERADAKVEDVGDKASPNT